MGKTCTTCGRPLPFFAGLIHARCDECRSRKTGSRTGETPGIKPELVRRNLTRIGGGIEYYHLQDWLFNNFSSEEQDTILSVYTPSGPKENPLVQGKKSTSPTSAVGFLSGMAGWFKKPEYRRIGYKILEKGESLVSEKTPVIDRHFLYQAKLENYYRNRETDDFALPAAIEACRQQIGISKEARRAFLQEYKNSPLPSHAGFSQLCVILEHQKNYDEAIHLASEAKEQGWAGHWDERIEKCRKEKER